MNRGDRQRTILALFLPLLLLLTSSNLSAGTYDIKTRIENDRRLFSIEVRSAELSDVLRALAHQSGFNIILGEGVRGKVTLSFRDIAFKDALEIIIKANGLTYTIQNNVFWVGKDVDTSDDIRMDIVRLNYADPAIAATKLKGTLGKDGTAVPDPRTDSVILRALPEDLARARKLLEEIDTQTPQVVIEARIVEASSTFTRQLGIQWGGKYTQGANTITGSSLLPQSGGSRNFAVNLPAAGPTAGLGIVVGSLSSGLMLDLELSAAESNGDLRIVSSPRIATLNNTPATIHSGLTFRVKITNTLLVDAAATTSTTTTAGLEEIKTGIDLTVTPKISADGFVLLKIDTKKSDPDFSRTIDGIPGVTEKSAQTSVLVKDGDTVVIGGLYKTLNSETINSVPLLSKLPVLGFLFRSQTKEQQDEELLVFITPNIVKRDAPKGVLD
jgi:type IV pilus assembly protein PilQ